MGNPNQLQAPSADPMIMDIPRGGMLATAGVVGIGLIGGAAQAEAHTGFANVDQAAAAAMAAPKVGRVLQAQGNVLPQSPVVENDLLIPYNAMSTQARVSAAEAMMSEAPEAPTSDPSSPTYDPEALKQYCTDIALAKPQIIKSQLLNVGNFDRTPYQSYFLSGRYQPWPEECGGFARGNQARGQAFYKGRWVNMNYWRGVGILRDTNIGNWVGDIANLDNLRFPVCRARIQLKANIVDLSVSMNEDTPWKPQHPTIAKTQFAPIQTKILPRKPKVCN